MGFQLGGQTFDDVQINGEPASEVQLNGVPIWQALTAVEDFSHNDIDAHYFGDTSTWSIDQTRNFHQGYALDTPTDSGGVDYLYSIPQASLDFDGIDDHVATPYNPNDGDLGGGGTLAAWVKVETTGQQILGSWGNPRFYVGRNSGGYLQTGFGNDWSDSGSGHVTIGEWRHIAVTNDGSNSAGYLEGNEIHTYSSSFSGSNSNELHIGRVNNQGHEIEGLIADVRIYDRELSAGEVVDLANGVHISNGLIRWWPISEGQGSTTAELIDGDDGALNGPQWDTEVPEQLSDGPLGIASGNSYEIPFEPQAVGGTPHIHMTFATDGAPRSESGGYRWTAHEDGTFSVWSFDSSGSQTGTDSVSYNSSDLTVGDWHKWHVSWNDPDGLGAGVFGVEIEFDNGSTAGPVTINSESSIDDRNQWKFPSTHEMWGNYCCGIYESAGWWSN